MRTVKNYRKLATMARNIAEDVPDPEEREKLLSLAREYDEKAQLRERVVKPR